MRLLFVLLLFNYATLSIALSQQPTRDQMQAQAAQAKKESLEMIAEMEKDIADAKKSGENAETIAEMEKNLAMMKKMLGIVDKVSAIKQPPTIKEGNNTVAPYKSPYIKFYKQPIVVPTEAQAKDKLLWYRGKKIDQNTLITTKGRVIQYDKQNNRVRVQYNEKKDTSILKIIANLAKSRLWTKNYVDKKSAEKNSFFDYPMVMLAMERFELIEKEFDKIANNALELPGTGTQPRAEIFYDLFSTNTGPSANTEGSIDPYIKEQMEIIKSLMNNAPPLDVTPPPKAEFGLCYYCDPGAQERYYREKEIWGTAFTEYEASIMNRVLAIERYYQLLGVDSEPEVGTMFTGELGDAWGFAQNRIDQKIELLKQRFGRDIYRYECVVTQMLARERQRQLLGMGDDFAAVEPEIMGLSIFYDFIMDRIAANDYDVMFNYAMILGFARQKQLLGLSEEETDTWQPMYDAVVKHNRFALTLDLDFETHIVTDESVIIATGMMTTKQKIYLKLGRTSDCK
jgi:hypothetical protein